MVLNSSSRQTSVRTYCTWIRAGWRDPRRCCPLWSPFDPNPTFWRDRLQLAFVELLDKNTEGFIHEDEYEFCHSPVMWVGTTPASRSPWKYDPLHWQRNRSPVPDLIPILGHACFKAGLPSHDGLLPKVNALNCARCRTKSLPVSKTWVSRWHAAISWSCQSLMWHVSLAW